jgi:hypothetical protein
MKDYFGRGTLFEGTATVRKAIQESLLDHRWGLHLLSCFPLSCQGTRQGKSTNE